MKGNKTALAVYSIVVVCLAFVLGYLLGHGNGQTNVSVIASPPQIVEQAETAESTTENVSASNLREPTASEPLDLNTASAEQLELLPGIGPGLAERIIAYRQENGAFVAKEQIMDVEGIGEKRYAEIEPLIIIGGAQ